MDIRRIQFTLFAALVLLVAGCQKSQSAEDAPAESSPHPRPAPAAPMPAIARIHWLGMKQISHDANSASLMAIWKLPQSRKLERQTLVKSSLAPWRLLHRRPDTNAAARLRPLLDDVVSNESWLEIRRAGNQPWALAFAIRLDPRRAALWATNLAQVLESLTGLHPVPAPDHHYGWSLKKHHAPNLIELTRAGHWTILGAAEDHNGVVADMKSRIQHGQAPLAVENTTNWFTADLNPARLLSSLTTLNHFHITVTGDGTNVLTRGRVDFSKPLTIDWQPWNIPTNLIDEPVCSFTLIRGFKPWLKSSRFWQNLRVGPAPDQLCFWAEPGLRMLSYFTAPLPEASNEVDRLTAWVLQRQEQRFPANSLAKFARSTKYNGLEWKGLPYMSPSLRSVAVNHQNFIYGEGFPNRVTKPLSLKPLRVTLSRTNLLYHDWEITGLRIEQWLYMGQFARYVSHKAQLPFHSPGTLWLKAIAPKLGASLTDVTQTGPSQLSFSRKSDIGFTAIELHLLADWLESPQFPIGLHTFLAPPPPPKKK